MLLLSLSFLAGGMMGCLAEGRWLFDASLQGFISQAADNCLMRPALWRELWVLLRWPVFALAAGSLPLAGLTMPALFFLRGFFLSCGISAFMTGSGGAEWATGALLYGPACLLALPVFFILGMEGLREDGSGRCKKVCVVMFSLSALLVCAFLDCRVTPLLLSVILRLDPVS